MGSSPFSEEAFKYKLPRFIYNERKVRQHVEKYNAIGKDGSSDFEKCLGINLTKDDKETLIWIWDDLFRLCLITPMGKYLV